MTGPRLGRHPRMRHAKGALVHNFGAKKRHERPRSQRVLRRRRIRRRGIRKRLKGFVCSQSVACQQLDSLIALTTFLTMILTNEQHQSLCGWICALHPELAHPSNNGTDEVDVEDGPGVDEVEDDDHG